MKTKQLQPLFAALLGLALSCGSCADSSSNGNASYEAKGAGTNVIWSGKICNLEEPFSLLGSRPNGDLTFKFTPGSNSQKGTWTYHNDQSSGGVTEDGQGTYDVLLKENEGAILLVGETTLVVPGVRTFQIPVNEAIDLTPINGC